MQPEDRALVQKHLSATLAKVAKFKTNIVALKKNLERESRALQVNATATKIAGDSKPVSDSVLNYRPVSILDDNAVPLPAALKKLASGCNCLPDPANKPNSK